MCHTIRIFSYSREVITSVRPYMEIDKRRKVEIRAKRLAVCTRMNKCVVPATCHQHMITFTVSYDNIFVLCH
jgi:hypothetical protein